MNVIIENIGPLDHAEFEVGNLTVLCGLNGTGKTYVTYALYGFLRSWRQIFAYLYREAVLESWRSQGGASLDLLAVFGDSLTELLDALCAEYAEELPRALGAERGRFEQTRFRIEASAADLVAAMLETRFEMKLTGNGGDAVAAAIVKARGSDTLEIERTSNAPGQAWGYFLADAVGRALFGAFLPPTFIASAERTGAAIFRNELDFARQKWQEVIQAADREALKNPWLLYEQFEIAYPWPVQDDVDFVRQIESLPTESGAFLGDSSLSARRFEEILGGRYQVSKGQGLRFLPQSGRRLALSLKESHSAIRSLVDVFFWLRHKAEVGSLLMIDEPELSLHPANQRRFARLLAILANQGAKVFITTHSDYIVKELNSLIGLGRRSAAMQAIQRRYGYEDAELLTPSAVRLYTTGEEQWLRPGNSRKSRRTCLVPAEVSETEGMEAATFDKDIAAMNSIQNEIYLANADAG